LYFDFVAPFSGLFCPTSLDKILERQSPELAKQCKVNDFSGSYANGPLIVPFSDKDEG
jgi:hypothetical protein